MTVRRGSNIRKMFINIHYYVIYINTIHEIRYFIGAVALVHFYVHSRKHFPPVLQDYSSSSTERKRTEALQGMSETNYWQSHCNFYPITRALSPSALWENQHHIQGKERWKEKKNSSSIAIELTAICAGLFDEKRTARGKVLRYLFRLWELGGW